MRGAARSSPSPCPHLHPSPELAMRRKPWAHSTLEPVKNRACSSTAPAGQAPQVEVARSTGGRTVSHDTAQARLPLLHALSSSASPALLPDPTMPLTAPRPRRLMNGTMPNVAPAAVLGRGRASGVGLGLPSITREQRRHASRQHCTPPARALSTCHPLPSESSPRRTCRGGFSDAHAHSHGHRAAQRSPHAREAAAESCGGGLQEEQHPQPAAHAKPEGAQREGAS